MSFFRFPGGKKKLRKNIISKLSEFSGYDLYIEPFFGGGSIGLDFIKNSDVKSIWMNDKDFALSCLWTSVIKCPSLLKYYVRNFTPSVDLFLEYKKYLLSDLSFENKFSKIVEIGFKKLAIHQISYSGLGVKSGGPLGGIYQKSKYKINCRWSPEYICKNIDYYNNVFTNLDVKHNCCTFFDFEEVFKNKNTSLIYLDPPYFEKGSELYQYSFLEEDHVRLSKILQETNHHWLLSYDDCEQIRDLYSWATIQECPVTYTINGSIKKQELLIYAK